MSEEHDHRTEDFYADIAVRLIENEVLKENTPKVALILAGVLDFCTVEDDDSADVVELKGDILAQVVHELLYHEVAYAPTEEEIDSTVKSFGEWLNAEIPETKNTQTEEEN